MRWIWEFSRTFHPLQIYVSYHCVLGGLDNNLDRANLPHKLISSRPLHSAHQKAETPGRRLCPQCERKHALVPGGGAVPPWDSPLLSAAHHFSCPRPALSASSPLRQRGDEWRRQGLRACYFNMYWLKKKIIKGRESFQRHFRITISWYKKTLFSNNNVLKKKIHHAIKVFKSFTECFKPLGTNYGITVLTSFFPE